MRDRHLVAQASRSDHLALEDRATGPRLQIAELVSEHRHQLGDRVGGGRAPAKVIFLLLMPPRAQDSEVRILAQIARAVIEPASRASLLEAHSFAEVLTLLSAPRAPTDSWVSRRASLADI